MSLKDSKGRPQNKWEDSGEYWASVSVFVRGLLRNPADEEGSACISNRNAEDAANDGQDRQNHAIYSVAVPKTRKKRGFCSLATAVSIASLGVASMGLAPFQVSANAATTAKVGGKCTKLNATSGTLVCTKKAGKLVWSRASVTTTTVAPGVAKTSSTVAKETPSTTAVGVAATPKATQPGIEGTWRATSKSEVGYRVKEVLIGQSTEGVGRTNAVTGTMTIAGTKVNAVELVVDVTKLKSDSDRRDGQVQNRILDTAKFPTATLKLASPIDFGSDPADKQEVKEKATVALTVRGVTKNITFDLIARKNGAAIEVNGAIPFSMSDFGIPDPSIVDLVKTEQNGLLEFLVVFER